MGDSRADRLPWLESSPQEGAPRRGKTGKRRWWPALLLAAALVAAGSYWLGQRVGEPILAPPLPSSPSTQTVALPPPAPSPQVAPAPLPAPPSAAEIAPAPQSPPSASAPRKKIQRAKSHARAKARRHAHAKKRKATWVRPPLAGPPGRVIQVGAFNTPREADRAWRFARSRYPELAYLPKLVAPTNPRPGQRRLYRLQFLTRSQAQSLVVCQRLEMRRQGCVVLYR